MELDLSKFKDVELLDRELELIEKATAILKKHQDLDDEYKIVKTEMDSIFSELTKRHPELNEKLIRYAIQGIH